MLASAVTPPSSRTQLLPPKSSMLHLKVIVKLKKLGLVVFQKKNEAGHTNPCQIVLIEEDDRPYLKYTDVLKNRPGGINNSIEAVDANWRQASLTHFSNSEMLGDLIVQLHRQPVCFSFLSWSLSMVVSVTGGLFLCRGGGAGLSVEVRYLQLRLDPCRQTALIGL